MTYRRYEGPVGGLLVPGEAVLAATTVAALRKTTYTEQSADAQRSFASGSANDTAAGTGARTVEITYYDSTGAGPYTETVTLLGATRVNTVATNICFVESLVVKTAGSTGSNVGIVSIYTQATSGGSAFGTIAATDNRTYWGHHYVGLTKSCVVLGLAVDSNVVTATDGADVYLRSKAIGVTAAAEQRVTDGVRVSGGAPHNQRRFMAGMVINGPAVLVAYAGPDTNTSLTYRATMELFEQ